LAHRGGAAGAGPIRSSEDATTSAPAVSLEAKMTLVVLVTYLLVIFS
jgi:hypothetical protein